MDPRTESKRKRRPFTKERVARWLKERFLLRLHMTFILGGTFLTGLVATTFLLAAGVDSMWWRYVLAVVIAYVGFLTLIRLWLWYVGFASGPDDLAFDVIELTGHGVSGTSTVLESAGGAFGGGGASASWGDPTGAVSALKSSGSSSGGGGAGGWKLPSFDLDFEEGTVVVVFLLLVAALLFAGIYILYAAPTILAEAAFEAALAGALMRGARKVDRPGWVGAVWRATVWPFLAILVMAGLLGWLAQNHCPEARELRDVFSPVCDQVRSEQG